MGAESSNASVLHRVSGIVSSPLSLDEMLGEIVGLAARVTSCDACLVYLAEVGYRRVCAARFAPAARFGLGKSAREDGRRRHRLGGRTSVSGGVEFESRGRPALEDFPDPGRRHLSGISFRALVINKGKAIGVINIHHRDKHEHEPEEIATISFIGEQMGSAIAKSMLEEENARLSEETAEMKRQLETRKSVERAKGILQKRHALSEEEAYLRMRNESRRLRRPMKDLADAIILSEELSRKDSSAPA